MKEFNYWKQLHESERLEEFSVDKTGSLWLKIKSIVRKEVINEFIVENNILLNEATIGKQFFELFELLSLNVDNSHSIINRFIKIKNQELVDHLNVNQLVSEL